MDLALTEAREHLRKWEKKDTPIYALLLPHSQEFKVSTSGRIRTEADSFMVTHDTGCEVSIALTEDMRFEYSDAILEIKAPLWRCILHEPGD